MKPDVIFRAWSGSKLFAKHIIISRRQKQAMSKTHPELVGSDYGLNNIFSMFVIGEEKERSEFTVNLGYNF